MVEIRNDGEYTSLKMSGPHMEVYFEMGEVLYRWYQTMRDDLGYSEGFIDGMFQITKLQYKEDHDDNVSDKHNSNDSAIDGVRIRREFVARRENGTDDT